MYIDVHEANPPHKHISLVYYGTTKNSDFIMSDEHSDMRWLTQEDLELDKFNLSESIKYYCNEAIKLAKSK